MKRQLLLFLFLLLTASGLRAQVQYTTESPRVDDINDTDVSIQRVELTAQYTIIYMKFESNLRRSPNRGWPFSIPMPNAPGGQLESVSNIGFQPTSRLYVNQGERSYKFIRAENIPAETRRRVQPGERVDFVAYFERIDPGYTVFDLYECKDGGGYVCFNFWGVHIINPAKKTYSQRTPKPQTRPQQPRYQPRTSPGVGKPEVTPPATAPKVEPVPVAVAINGVTRNAKTKETVSATISYQLISGAESAGDAPADSVRSDKPSGNYSIPVSKRGVYAITVSAKGYFSQSDTLATNRVSVNRDFDLIPIEAGATVTLKNIYFNASEYDLKPESYPELDRLAGLMLENPTMTIRLEGHTDTVGEFDANVELSRNRVNEVKRYLVAKGIDSDRIDTVGYGPSRPINKNKSLKERPENRRVEMVIVNV
ncbi:OmpA family protein [Spirosoma sp. SC4-14]|uniref:OmpA family protein n=1 Tax=Spirosoma sp. SC4-14 TaxID=3128900 RepID=UPI0030CA5DF3